MTSHTERKETRLVARTSPEVQELIQRAADCSGATVSQFLIEAAMERARDVIERTHTLQLSISGAEALFSALENPPEPNSKLLTAAKRYKELMRDADDRGDSKLP